MKIIESRALNDISEYSLQEQTKNVQNKSLSKESSLILLFKSAFLPVGYPQTVSSDYINYQTYDTLQAFCSSFIGMLSTRSMLRGFGVGDSNSSVLHALLTWTLRDGIQMISRIIFAYIYSYKFSSQLKSWRYAADFFNNIGYALDFTAASFENKMVFTLFASLSVIFKTLTAVAGGATKSALTNHFAIKGNTADLDAKDGSQETLVNLIGMIIGSYLIQCIPLENLKVWIIFIVLGSLHLYFNYLAISAVILVNINRQRARIIFDHYITKGSIPSPDVVARKESLRFYNDDIYIGESIYKLGLQDQAIVIKKFQNQDTVMIKDQKKRFIFLSRGLSRETILKAYLLAVLDQTNQLLKSKILEQFTSELFKSGWNFNIADLDLQGYEYYKVS